MPPWDEYNLTVTFITMFVVLSLQSPCSAVVCENNGKLNVWPYTKRTAMDVSAKRDSQEEIVKPVRLFPMAVILNLYKESVNF